MLRACFAAVLSLSWLLMAGLPASAAVTRVYVDSPKPDAVLGKAGPTPLVVLVDRTASPQEERVAVETRLLNAKDKPLHKGVLGLKPSKKPLPPRDDQPPSSDRLEFTGEINPYALAWLKGAIAPNAEYHLQYRAVVALGEDGNPTRGEWQTYRFWLNAPPPPMGPPAAEVADAAAKRLAVAWNVNAAPDVVSYTVERRRDGGTWQVAQADIKPAKTTTMQITDTVAKFGTYRYRVVAFRPVSEPPKEEPPPGDGEVDSAQATEAPEEPEDKEPVKLRGRVSPPSAAVALGVPDEPAPRGQAGSGNGSGTGGTGSGTGSPGTGFGSGTGSVPSVPGGSTSNSGQASTQPFNPQTPDISAPPGFEETYDGPLSYGPGTGPNSVTERVPVEIARGGAAEDDTLTVLNRAIDQQRVLPPVAGGLILVISAAHVLRYLNE